MSKIDDETLRRMFDEGDDYYPAGRGRDLGAVAQLLVQLALIGAIIITVWAICRLVRPEAEVRERAAYLQGRYELPAADALFLARAEYDNTRCNVGARE